jgi:hypothetical protein
MRELASGSVPPMLEVGGTFPVCVHNCVGMGQSLVNIVAMKCNTNDAINLECSFLIRIILCRFSKVHTAVGNCPNEMC